jgi:hypothetical protein
MIEYEKQGCLWPILHSHKGSFGPINLSWLQEAGDRLKIRVLATQEVQSPPAFLGAILPACERVIQELTVGGRTFARLPPKIYSKLIDEKIAFSPTTIHN